MGGGRPGVLWFIRVGFFSAFFVGGGVFYGMGIFEGGLRLEGRGGLVGNDLVEEVLLGAEVGGSVGGFAQVSDYVRVSFL